MSVMKFILPRTTQDSKCKTTNHTALDRILLVVEVDVLDNVGGTFEKFGDPVSSNREHHTNENAPPTLTSTN